MYYVCKLPCLTNISSFPLCHANIKTGSPAPAVIARPVTDHDPHLECLLHPPRQGSGQPRDRPSLGGARHCEGGWPAGAVLRHLEPLPVVHVVTQRVRARA